MEIPIPEENERDFIALMRILIDYVSLDNLSAGQSDMVSMLHTFVETYDPETGEVTTEEKCDVDL